MATREARRSRTAAITGIGTLVVAGLIGYLLLTVHTGLPFAQITKVRAAFENVDSLAEGDQVRQNSVRIGTVSAIEFVDGRAVVTMELEGDKPVYRNARAAVYDYTAVGTKFVELYRGTPDAGPLGDAVIPVARTVSSDDLYEILNVLDEPTRAAAQSGIQQLGGGAAGHSRDLHAYLASSADLLTDLDTVADALAAEGTNLPALLRSADRLARRFAGREQDISALIRQADATFRALSVDEARPLSDSLQQLPGTLERAQTAFDAVEDPLADTESALAALRTGAEALGASERDLRGVLRESIGPLGRVPSVAEQAEPAVEDLTRTFADARPFAPRVTRALDSAAPMLQVMAPYAPEFGEFAVRGNSFLAAGAALPGLHYARLGVAVGQGSALGVVPGADGLKRNVYPAPGEASQDGAKSLFGGGE